MAAKAYKYLFYKLYKWHIWLTGKNNLPEYSSAFLMALLLSMNLFSIPSVIELLTGVVIRLPPLSRVIVVSVFSALMGVYYYFFIRDNKYKDIINEAELVGEKMSWTIMVIAYVVLSLVVFFGSYYVILMRREALAVM